MFQSLLIVLLPLAGQALAQQPYGAQRSAVPVFAPAPARATSNDEAATLVAENPTLVHELLASDGGENAGILSVFCLGPAAIDPLIAELKQEDETLRTMAAMALCYACAHENAPRSKVVQAFLAFKKEQPDADIGEMLALVTRMTRADFRATIRRAVETELTGEPVGAPGVQACGPNGCPAPYYAPADLVPITPATSSFPADPAPASKPPSKVEH